MTESRTRFRIYTVIDVMSGVVVEVENFSRIEDARRWLKRLRRGRNFNEDDVQLFEGVIDLSTVRHIGDQKTRLPSTKRPGSKKAN